jgi:hypothetical protein
MGWAIGATLVALALAAAPARAADTDLVLTSSYSPSPATVNQNTTLTLVTVNHGGSATHVKVQVALPVSLPYVSGDPGCMYPDTDGKVTCVLPDLAGGASATVKFIVKPSAAGSATAGAVVSSTEPDTSPTDNTSTTTVDVNPAPKASPTISATVSGTPQAFQPQTLTATLAGGSTPTGKIDFQVFAPSDTACSGSPLAASIVDLNAAEQATSDPFSTGTGGTYRWTATYLGDDGNNAVSTPCGANDEAIKALPQIDLAVGVSGATALISKSLAATGTLTFTVYADAVCATPIASATVPVGGDGSYSGAYTLPRPGSYIVTVAYSGDARNAAETPPGCTGGGAVTIQPATPPRPPDNHFSFGSTKLRSTGTITLSLTAPGAGVFSATAHYGSTSFGKVSVRELAKGNLKLTIKPSAAGKRLLKKHTKLKLSVSVTFTPTGGTPLTRKLTVTLTGR